MAVDLDVDGDADLVVAGLDAVDLAVVDSVDVAGLVDVDSAVQDLVTDSVAVGLADVVGSVADLE